MPDTTTTEQLLEGLNPPQREAVTYGEGPLLILAGAGSGKTRVLTHRIAWLLRTGRARRAMWVMTFHSACARMLRADAHRLGYTRQFTIYDGADSRRLIKRCLDEQDV